MDGGVPVLVHLIIHTKTKPMIHLDSNEIHDVYKHIYEFKLKEKEYKFLYHHMGHSHVFYLTDHYRGTFIMTDDIKKMMHQLVKRLTRKSMNVVHSYTTGSDSIGHMSNISFDDTIMYDLKTGQPIFGPYFNEHKMDFIDVPRGRSLTINLIIKVKKYKDII